MLITKSMKFMRNFDACCMLSSVTKFDYPQTISQFCCSLFINNCNQSFIGRQVFHSFVHCTPSAIFSRELFFIDQPFTKTADNLKSRKNSHFFKNQNLLSNFLRTTAARVDTFFYQLTYLFQTSGQMKKE